MRNQSKEIIDKLDKKSICNLLKVEEKELYEMGVQEVFHNIQKEIKKEDKIQEDYYLLVENFGLSNYLLSLKEDEIMLDMKFIYNNYKYLRDFFEEEIEYEEGPINEYYFERWSEFYIKGKDQELEKMLGNEIFVYKNDNERIIQLVKAVLITKYEDDEHHEYRNFKEYDLNLKESFKIDKILGYRGYKVYCYYFGLYDLSGEAEIFSINTKEYLMRGIDL